MLKLFLVLIFLVILSTSNAIKLKLSNGLIEGKTVEYNKHTLHMFKKLPFAQPPLNDLRFRKPQPVLDWSGTLNATVYAPSCMINFTNSDLNMTYSEDCLYINVFTSQKCLKSRDCPVFVMLHGGSFVFGNAVQYNDSHILHKFAQHDIVFVLPAFRVGFFGFIDLGHDYEDAPYNVGLYDVIFGLEWIQREIKEFGGDPDEVTLMGYSSGADTIQYLLASPKMEDRRLFKRVMQFSGLPYIKPGMNRDITRRLLNVTGCHNYTRANTTSDYSSWTTTQSSSHHSSVSPSYHHNKSHHPVIHSSVSPSYHHTKSHHPVIKPNSSIIPSTSSNIKEHLECLRSLSAKELNDATGALIDYWGHLRPQSNRDLFPGKNYDALAKKRKPIPMVVMTSRDEMGTLHEPYDNIHHVCKERLSILGYEQKETIAACVKRYGEDGSNDTYPIIRDMYHAHAVRECQINSGGDNDDKDNGKGWWHSKSGGYNQMESKDQLKQGEFDVGEIWRRIKHGGKDGKGRKDGKSSDLPDTSCFLGLFAQTNHTLHANEMYYLVGQHANWYGEPNVNDELMDNFFPQMVRNFVKGKKPLQDWPATTKKGLNYYYFSFDLLSENRSDHEFPHPMPLQVFDKEAVDFLLVDLLAIERNASQFHRATKKRHGSRGVPILMAKATNDKETDEYYDDDDWVDEDEWVNDDEPFYVPSGSSPEQRHFYESEYLYGYTSLWTLFLFTLVLIIFGIIFQMQRKRQRETVYSSEPLQPIRIGQEKGYHFNYQTI